MGIALLAIVTACAQEVKPPQGIPTAVSPEMRVRPDAFSETIAWKHLLKQVEFGPRVPGSPGHLACRDWLVEELKKVAQDVRLQEFTHTWSRKGEKKTMFNVLATQNWDKATIRVVLLAHWDTRPYADQEMNPALAVKPIAGANDGASGVAVLLETARVMRMRKPDIGIMYLFTDGEDLGPGLDEMFLGAVHFGKNLPSPKPDYGILLDMIGDADLRIPMEPTSRLKAPKVLNAFFNFASSHPRGKVFVKERGPDIVDDHIALNEAGIPTIDLIDFDYPYWHTMGDTPDKCSAKSLGDVGHVLVDFLSLKPVFAPK